MGNTSVDIENLLLVEDNDKDMILIQTKLHNLHAVIDIADNLEMAYRCATGVPPDLILLDVGVPTRSGNPIALLAEVLEFVRYHAEKHCVVILTGNSDADESDIRMFYAAGAVDYISKDTIGIDLALLERVRRAYRAHRLSKDNIPAAQFMMQMSKMESRQDKMFIMFKRIDRGINTVRESEKKLVHEQAFKAGGEAKVIEINRQKRLRAAVAWGSFLAGLYAFGEIFASVIRGFRDRR